MVSCCLWVLAAVVRLAKFNVISAKASHTFFGVPTTLCAGTLATWILVLGKYADPSSGMQPQAGPKLLGEWSLGPSVWNVLPACMIFGAVLMVSNLPMPKLGLLRSRLLNLVVLTNVLAGYACGFARIIPEYMVVLPTMWLLIGLSWGSIAPQARLCRPPSFLPR
jgi:CDP-diacylglycerol--serine O-phosphatidyltransferase